MDEVAYGFGCTIKERPGVDLVEWQWPKHWKFKNHYITNAISALCNQNRVDPFKVDYLEPLYKSEEYKDLDTSEIFTEMAKSVCRC